MYHTRNVLHITCTKARQLPPPPPPQQLLPPLAFLRNRRQRRMTTAYYWLAHIIIQLAVSYNEINTRLHVFFSTCMDTYIYTTSGEYPYFMTCYVFTAEVKQILVTYHRSVTLRIHPKFLGLITYHLNSSPLVTEL